MVSLGCDVDKPVPLGCSCRLSGERIQAKPFERVWPITLALIRRAGVGHDVLQRRSQQPSPILNCYLGSAQELNDVVPGFVLAVPSTPHFIGTGTTSWWRLANRELTVRNMSRLQE